jgi:hypothetical protein
MNTRNQKCHLEDPGDISIARAPQAPKKTRKKATGGGTNNSTAPASNSILPASVANPTPANNAPMPTEGVSDVEITTAPKPKAPPKKKKAKKGAAATILADAAQAPDANATPESTPKDNNQTSNKRRATPSLKAQQGECFIPAVNYDLTVVYSCSTGSHWQVVDKSLCPLRRRKFRTLGATPISSAKKRWTRVRNFHPSTAPEQTFGLGAEISCPSSAFFDCWKVRVGWAEFEVQAVAVQVLHVCGGLPALCITLLAKVSRCHNCHIEPWPKFGYAYFYVEHGCASFVPKIGNR